MSEHDDKARELFEEVERRAFMELPEDEEQEDVDVIAALRAPAGTEVDATELDMLLTHPAGIRRQVPPRC